MLTFGAIIAQALHVALMLAAAPLLVGVVRWLKARMLGRRGASPLQPLRDLDKLLRKRPVLAENASIVSEAAPYAGFAACLVAIALVPSFAQGMAFEPLSDLVLLAGLLGVARIALALAGMDVGTGMAGMQAGMSYGQNATNPNAVQAYMNVILYTQLVQLRGDTIQFYQSQV